MKFKLTTSIQGAFLLTALVFSHQTTFAQQAHFIKYGEIEFEKKVNLFAKLRKKVTKNNGGVQQNFLDEYQKTQPQFYSERSKLSFSEESSIYRSLEDDKQLSDVAAREPWVTIKNIVYRNFKTDSVLAIKKVYGEEFVIKDKKQPILWKLTNEVREISGYKCKRANGLILDSIYVVAFYSEEITPSGGPESFSGLPGMILGIALPNENITWFATKIEVNPHAYQDMFFQLLNKKKSISRMQYQSVIETTTKNWRNSKAEFLKASLL